MHDCYLFIYKLLCAKKCFFLAWTNVRTKLWQVWIRSSWADRHKLAHKVGICCGLYCNIELTLQVFSVSCMSVEFICTLVMQKENSLQDFLCLYLYFFISWDPLWKEYEPFCVSERRFMIRIRGIQRGIWTEIDFTQSSFKLVDL